jgi:excinuclease ABC subunit A
VRRNKAQEGIALVQDRRKEYRELAAMDIRELSVFMDNIEERMSDKQRIIAAEILKEIRARLGFLVEVGLITFP